MTSLLPPKTPLYNHPLPQLERWLRELGAHQQGPNACHWDLQAPDWQAEISLDIDQLSVRWRQADGTVERHFPYGFSRADVEAAILAGP